MKNLLYSLLLCLLLAATTAAQKSFNGKIVDVPSNNTVVVQTLDNRRIKITLAFVETPSPDTPLGVVVKDHLAKIALYKPVEVVVREMVIEEARAIGKVTINGQDLSLQLLRDGAAWYQLPEQNKQAKAEQKVYLENETAAKNEKRGVWSDEKLKPTWVETSDLETVVANPDPKKQENKPARRAVGGLNQFDALVSIRPTEAQAESAEKQKSVEYQSIKDVSDKLREFLLQISDEGVTLSEFTTEYRRISRLTEEASNKLPRGKIKTLMEQNIRIMHDCGFTWQEMRKQNLDFVYYRGYGKEIADRYKIEPVRNNKNDFILTRKMLFEAMMTIVAKNHNEIVGATQEEYGSNNQ